MTEKPDWIALIDDLDDPLDLETRATRIADILATGTASPLFLKMLAEAIRPRSKKADRYVFILSHRKEGRPEKINWPLGFEMARLVDGEGQTPDTAIHLVQQQFGVEGNRRSACLKALRAARKWNRLDTFYDQHVKPHNPRND